jgi:hypothetical protein
MHDFTRKQLQRIILKKTKSLQVSDKHIKCKLTPSWCNCKTSCNSHLSISSTTDACALSDITVAPRFRASACCPALFLLAFPFSPEQVARQLDEAGEVEQHCQRGRGRPQRRVLYHYKRHPLLHLHHYYSVSVLVLVLMICQR